MLTVLTPPKFLSQVEVFLRTTGMSPTAFGREIVNDPNFVFQLRGGRLVSLRVAAQVDEFMRRHRRKKGRRKAS